MSDELTMNTGHKIPLIGRKIAIKSVMSCFELNRDLFINQLAPIWFVGLSWPTELSMKP